MQIQNDDDIMPIEGVDPLSARVLASHARQKEMARFLGHAGQGLFRVLRWLVKPLTNWHRRNVLYGDLQALPDYLLKDIGFTRDEITAVVYHQLRRQPLSLSPTGSQPASTVSGTENENREQKKPLAA